MANAAGDDERVVLVLSTAPNADVASQIARALVEERLAACVSRVPGVVSTYRFEGAIHEDREELLVVKTAHRRLADLMVRLAALHPYDVPEVVAVETASVSGPYAAWVRSVTS